MFRTSQVQKNILIFTGILVLVYVLVFLLSPESLADFTVVDTEYWRETNHRLLVKTSYDYNDPVDVAGFPRSLGRWEGSDFRYPESVYKALKADIVLSRAYTSDGKIVWMDIINSRVGESFHKQRICVTGAGWNIDNETIARFNIPDRVGTPFTELYANRLDISKDGRRQVMVYWFMFKKFGSDDAVTMIRLTSPVTSTPEETFRVISDFVGSELFASMYETAPQATVVERLARSKSGMALVFLALALPVVMITMGLRRKI